jgi:hypothetical protein
MHQILSHTRQRTRRPCREHEREWRGYCVDHNLEDHWLEQLNELEVFDLISICEGHVTNHRNSPNGRPHVNLRIKRTYKSAVINSWAALHARLDQMVQECFNPESTQYEFELRLGTRSTRNGQRRREDFVVKLRSTTRRFTDGPEESLSNWYSEIVPSIRKFDQLLMESVHNDA